MPLPTRTLIGLVVGCVLLSGCSVLKLAITPPEQPVSAACLAFDNKSLASAMKTLEKKAESSPKTAAKAFDAFTTVFEAGIVNVENTAVKTRAQLTSIAMRNLAAELRTFKPDQAHRNALKDDLTKLKTQTTKLSELCGWS